MITDLDTLVDVSQVVDAATITSDTNGASVDL